MLIDWQFSWIGLHSQVPGVKARCLLSGIQSGCLLLCVWKNMSLLARHLLSRHKWYTPWT